MAFKIPNPLHLHGSPAKAVGDPKNPKPRTHAEILKAYPGAVKVPGKINTYKYKGTT